MGWLYVTVLAVATCAVLTATIGGAFWLSEALTVTMLATFRVAFSLHFRRAKNTLRNRLAHTQN